MRGLGHIDISIFWAYLAVILMTGYWAGRSVSSVADYAAGGKSYSTFFVFATISAAFIGGGFTMGLAEKTFSVGLVYVLALWGFSFKEILIAKFVAPRMIHFPKALSVGDIMGQLYGQNARVVTGIAGSFVCAGIAGAQFTAFSYVVHLFTGMDQNSALVLGAAVVMGYSTLGGMKAIVLNDTIHFCVLIVSLPLVFLFGLNLVGGWEGLMQSVPAAKFSFSQQMDWIAVLALFLSFFFGETLVPPYVQRLLIGKSTHDTARGTMMSGVLSIPFFLMMGLLGLIAFAMKPDLDPNLALPYVIQNVMPIGFKGLAVAGVMAVLLSSADSFLNAASVSLVHDAIKPLQKYKLSIDAEVRWTRIATVVVGSLGVVFGLSQGSVLEILLFAYNFWTPFILVPLVAGILGFYRPPMAFWASSSFGVVSVFVWRSLPVAPLPIDAALIGITASFVVFMLMSGQKKKLASLSGMCIMLLSF